MISGCSTAEIPVAAINVSQFCPPASTIASSGTFRTQTSIKKGETAFQTVKRFRLAEQKKNADGARMLRAYEACRKGTGDAVAKREEEEERRRKNANGGILGGV